MLLTVHIGICDGNVHPARGASNTMDYDWLGMKSEQHLTTELIETRLTKDILLDGIGETGKKR